MWKSELSVSRSACVFAAWSCCCRLLALTRALLTRPSQQRYYNGCLFYNVQQNFMIQTGDPTATGKGGTSVYGLMYGEQAR